MSSALRVFLSYSQEDKAWCDAFVQAFRDTDIDVWYAPDRHSQVAGDEQEDAEIRSRPIFILVVSPESIASPIVRRQLSLAVSDQGRSVPILVVARATSLPSEWSSFLQMSGSGEVGVEPYQAAIRVMKALSSIAGTDSSEPLESPLDDLLNGDRTRGGPDLDSPFDTLEHVIFTGYCPREIAPHIWEPLLIYIGLGSLQVSVLVEADASMRLRSRIDAFRAPRIPGMAPLRRGTKLTIVPHLRGFRFNPEFMSVVWMEDFQCYEFRMQVDNASAGQSVNGCVQFFEGIVLRGELPLSVYVQEQSLRAEKPEASSNYSNVRASAYRNTFVSYSRKDERVVRAFEAIAEASGDRFLRDIRTLRSGELWRLKTLRLIEAANVFQLFWSRFSAKSTEVEREWRYALTLLPTRPNFIRPVYWTPTPPPPELTDIDFGYLDAQSLGLERASLLDKLLGRG